MEQVYRWAQRLYSSDQMERLLTTVQGWLEGRTIQEVARWLGHTLLWVLALGLILDWALYWTREDQMTLVRRLWRGGCRLWQRLFGGRRVEAKAE
ncbi:MAG: hypothetical protein ACLSX2_05030 [Christensenellaceae bacterium]